MLLWRDHTGVGRGLVMAKYSEIDIKGAQGWKQILTGRKDMLAAFDSARDKSSKDKVQTKHGNVAEDAYRNWLQSFLPKKFGVVKGYIVSQGLSDASPMPEFDVIIYNQMESPVLWVEGSPDEAAHRRVRAIPAEHVCGVIEVKSAFSKRTSEAAIDKLRELGPYFGDEEVRPKHVPKFLPANFFCATVFFELRKADAKQVSAVHTHFPSRIRKYYGPLILRGEGLHPENSGVIWGSYNAEGSKPIPDDTPASLLEQGMHPISENGREYNESALMIWGPWNFSMTAMNFVALCNGTFDGVMANMHGKPPLQPPDEK